MPTMTAVEIAEYGGPDVLQVLEVPVPEPEDDEVLIRQQFAGVNYADIYMRKGLYAGSETYQVTLPFRLGFEGAGTVDAVGRAVRGLSPGDEVAYCESYGAYAEYTAVPERLVIKLPEGLSSEIATAVILQGITAHYLIHDAYPVQRGDICLIHAGAGGVGQILIQLARRRGARVLTTVGSSEKADIARSLGANEVILYRETNFRAAAREATGGRGVDVVYDSVGKDTIAGSIRSLCPRGYCILFGHASGKVDCVQPLALAEAGSVYLTRPHLAHYMRTPQEYASRVNAVFELVRTGRLRVGIDRRYRLVDAADAQRRLESRTSTGKILLET